MNSEKQLKSKAGSILIFSLWILATLAVFAAHIGLSIRQKVVLLSRIEHRSQRHWIAQSGVRKATAVLRKSLNNGDNVVTAYNKFYRHNNPESFREISVGGGTVSVSYPYSGIGEVSEQTRYGVVDEDRKININKVDRRTLKDLFSNIGVFDKNQAGSLSGAIIDWIEFGTSDPSGFYSDNYYENLKDPYSPKKGPFELLDEIQLVEGINGEVFEKIRPYITIYGDGLININTASYPVLLALGLDAEVAQKFLSVRRGLDGVEDTVDDYVFEKTFDIAAEMQKFIELKPEEVKQIDDLNASGQIKTTSDFFYIHSEGRLAQGEGSSVECIYALAENTIKYWKEK